MCVLIINFKNIDLSDEFFNTIDKCFENFGFYVSEYTNAISSDNESNDWKKIHIQDRKSFIEKSNQGHLQFGYLTIKDTYVYRLDIYFSNDNKDCELTLHHPRYVGSAYTAADDLAGDLFLRMQEIAYCIHTKLNAVGTATYNEYKDNRIDFSKDKIKRTEKIDRWPSDTLGDFIYWAEDPAEKLTKEKIYKEFYDYDIDKDWKPKLPLTYDPDIGEFFLTYTDPDGETPKRALLNTSLTSGACKFSDYENDTKFGSPTEAEIQKYRSIAWSTPTIQGVIDTLGEPDIRLGTVLYDPDEKSFSSTSHIRDIIDQICYTQLSDNVVVIFREYEDGLVVVNYAGKEKEGLH